MYFFFLPARALRNESSFIQEHLAPLGKTVLHCDLEAQIGTRGVHCCWAAVSYLSKDRGKKYARVHTDFLIFIYTY